MPSIREDRHGDLLAALSAATELARRHIAEPAVERFIGRPAVDGRTAHRNSCNLCEAICGIEVTVDAGRVVDIRGYRDDPLSLGHACPKSVSLADMHNDRDRLRRPVRRVGETWEEIGWDEAIDLVGRRLADIQKRYGANAVGIYFGYPTVRSLGGRTQGAAISSVLGTHNQFSATSVDQLPHQLISSLSLQPSTTAASGYRLRRAAPYSVLREFVPAIRDALPPRTIASEARCRPARR